MFHEDRDVVSQLKQESTHFHRTFDKHNALHDKIELEGDHLDAVELEKLKKEKLKLKDELYSMISEAKQKS